MSIDIGALAQLHDQRTRRYADHFENHPGAGEAVRLLLRNPQLGDQVVSLIRSQEHVDLDEPVKWNEPRQQRPA